MSENDLLQNQKDDHDEDQNDKDSGTHHHAPFLLRPLSLLQLFVTLLNRSCNVLYIVVYPINDSSLINHEN